MILASALVLGFLVFIHEGGHFLVARAFGVRVTEFMIGFPGPHIGFNWKGTRFGITAVPLGGYATVCGMLERKPNFHLKKTMAYCYERGTVVLEEVMEDLSLTEEEAFVTLEELCEWGSLVRPTRKDKYNIYRTPSFVAGVDGNPYPIQDIDAFFEHEKAQQYNALPFWKRVSILLAGPLANLLYALVMFVIVYSCIGFDLQNTTTGEIIHYTLTPIEAIIAGLNYIGAVVVAIMGLFNPATIADTMSNSTSIIGIAVISKSAFEAGLVSFLQFSAILSVSLGLMNLLPIPPLDGGRFVVEVIQKLTARPISVRVQNYVSTAGFFLFMAFFVVMVNQDIQRFVFGNWG